jgi:hypothetical protein
MAGSNAGHFLFAPSSSRARFSSNVEDDGKALITDRPDAMREVTTADLRDQGMTEWKALVLPLKGRAERNRSHLQIERTAGDLEHGCTIIMSVGDQWSYLDGELQAEVSVKLPNPSNSSRDGRSCWRKVYC